MTKSKKQYAAQQAQSSPEEFGRTIELAFGDHPWPASRTELLEHASRQQMFAKSDIARLKRIPHRDYHSISDLMQATREADMPTKQGTPSMQGVGPVATAENNRRAMGRASSDAHVSSAAPYDEQMS